MLLFILLFQDLVTGVNELKKVLEHQPSQTMKAITLYELGTAYVNQHRYVQCSVRFIR